MRFTRVLTRDVSTPIRTLKHAKVRLLLVRPAFFHQCIHFLWTCWWTLHAVPTFNEAPHLWSFHFLDKISAEKEL